jgi:predicted Fe-Mo cluster-binding NifX family protein
MKIAVSAEKPTPDSPVDPRFGRAACFMLYDDTRDAWDVLNNKQNLQSSQGAGIQSAAQVVNAGCQVLISGHCGPKAFAALAKAGVAVYATSAGSAQDAVDAYKRGKLTRMDSADVEGHW